MPHRVDPRPSYRYPRVPRRQALIDARERVGYTQGDLAKALDIRRDSLVMIEIGMRHPSFDLMLRWTKKLGVGFGVWDVDEDKKPKSVRNVA